MIKEHTLSQSHENITYNTHTVDMGYDAKIQVLENECNVYSVIEKITKAGGQDEPFYICDVSELLNRYKNWKKFMPRVKTYYAVKCNDSRIVLETLAALGIGFDCATKEEIRRVLSLGVPPERIIFANPTKKVSHITYASKVGVTAMTFDNEAELYKIKEYYPSADLLLRIKCDDVTAKYVLGSKFGADPEGEAAHLLRTAKQLQLHVIGVAFHVGSGCSNYGAFAEAVAAARRVFDVGAAVGHEMRLLDLGGGFPGRAAVELCCWWSRYPSIIWGPTCDSSDKISDDVIQLPMMEIGDWMIFEETGGYTLSISSEFNGFSTPNVHGVVNKDDWSLLTTNVHTPMSKDRFVMGDDLSSYLTGLCDPYQFKTTYF